MKHLTFGSAGLLLLTAMAATAQSAKLSAALNYTRDIRPILQARCAVCHSEKTLTTPALSGGLALDTFAAIKKGTGSGNTARPVLIAGKSADSELYKRLVATSASKLMPKGGPALPAAQIALFKSWIEAGAPAGDPKADSAKSGASPAALSMPATPARQEVRFPTLLKPSADLLEKGSPKDTALALALKVGPLPPVTALVFSPDGKTLAVGGYRAVTFWDLATGKATKAIVHLPGPVQSLAFRPDGAQLAIAGGAPGSSGEVQVYDTKTFTKVGATLEGHTDVVMSVAWSPDGKFIATGSQDKTARLWQWPEGKESKLFKDHSDGVTRVCFSPDGKALYTASMDHNLRRYDAEKGTLVRAFTGHNEGVTAMAYSPQNNVLISAGSETELRRWNPETGDNAGRYGGHSGTVTEIVFSKDMKFIASASGDHSIRIWDGGGNNALRVLSGSDDWQYAVAISPDDRWTVGGGADGIVRLWETASGRLRLMLLSWPADKSPVPEWAAITPEGYYDASNTWAKLLHPQAAERPAPRLATFVTTLRQPENVLKSWQAAPLDPAKLPPPVATPPTPGTPPAKGAAPAAKGATLPAKSATPPLTKGATPPAKGATPPAKGATPPAKGAVQQSKGVPPTKGAGADKGVPK
jgi:WD40 repeat protein